MALDLKAALSESLAFRTMDSRQVRVDKANDRQLDIIVKDKNGKLIAARTVTVENLLSLVM